jgi:hypothetical protein
MFCDTLREEVSQGDIFLDVTFARLDATGDAVTITTSRHIGILLTHDCEYDKKRVDFVLLARVRPLADLGADSQGNVRAGKVASALHLPERGPDFPEAFVDLYHIVPVRKAEVARLAEASQRIISLSDDGRGLLQRWISLFFGPRP